MKGVTLCALYWGKGEQGILQQTEDVEHSLPFDLLGFNSLKTKKIKKCAPENDGAQNTPRMIFYLA